MGCWGSQREGGQNGLMLFANLAAVRMPTHRETVVMRKGPGPLRPPDGQSRGDGVGGRGSAGPAVGLEHLVGVGPRGRGLGGRGRPHGLGAGRLGGGGGGGSLGLWLGSPGLERGLPPAPWLLSPVRLRV